MKQITKEEAVAFYQSGKWKKMSNAEIVGFQLFQSKLAVPMDVFHSALEKVLGRPVYTHEIGDRKRLIKEYLKLDKFNLSGIGGINNCLR